MHDKRDCKSLFNSNLGCMKRRILMFFTTLLICTCAFAQVKEVTGVVTSEDDGQPVTGASIRVEGTNLGTITDVDGKFSLVNLPPDAHYLQITYLGMQPRRVAIKSNLKVALSPD
jgi:hypothetical protein